MKEKGRRNKEGERRKGVGRRGRRSKKEGGRSFFHRYEIELSLQMSVAAADQ